MSWQNLLEGSPNPWLNVPTRDEGRSAWQNLIQPEPVGSSGGLIRGLLREVGADIAGAAKTVGAAIYSPFDAIGLAVPITFDDLSSRDLTGAAMVASMFVGAGIAGHATRAAKAARGIKAGDAFAKQLSAVHKAGIWAGSEAVAGGFFGAVRPLEQEENRAWAMLRDAGLFAGLGGAFSLAGSGVKATLGARIAEMTGRTRQGALKHLAEVQQTRQFLQEFAGIRLRSPDSKRVADIARQADGRVMMRARDAASGAHTDTFFKDFNEALIAATDSGYIERDGIPRITGALQNTEGLDKAVVEELKSKTGGVLSRNRIAAVIDELDLSGYEAVRTLANSAHRERSIFSWLGMETVAENITPLGEVILDPGTRRNILGLLPRDVGRRISKLEKDGDFLREAILEGVVDVSNISDAVHAKEFVRELVTNAGVPLAKDGSPWVYVARSTPDVTFLSKLSTPSFLAKLHPELRPWYELADAAAQENVAGVRLTAEVLRNMENTIPTAKLKRAVAILDDVGDIPNSAEARRVATEAAQSTNDPHIVAAMETTLGMLEGYRLRAVAKGRLGHIADADPAIVQQARQAIGEALQEAGGNALAAERLLRERFGRVDGWEMVDASPSETVQRLGGRIGATETVDLTKMRSMPDPPIDTIPKDVQQAIAKQGGDLMDLMMSDHPLAGKASDVNQAFYGKLYRGLEQLYEKGNIADFFMDNPEYRFLVPDYIPNLIASFRTSKEIGKLSPARITEVEQQFKQLLGGVSDPFDTTQFQRVIGPEAGSPLGETVRTLLDEAGRSGYFPIFREGQYRMAVNGAFHDYFPSLDAAIEAAAKLGDGGNVSISRAAFSMDAGATSVISGRDMRKAINAVKAASDIELTTSEAASMVREAGLQQGVTGPGRKYSRFLQERKLGLRSFSEDPYRALKFYSYNMERTLAFDTFERQAQQLIDNIPAAKTQLRQWVEDQTDLVLGRPTKLETAFQTLAERWFPGEVEPRLLRRWSNLIRRYQSNFRLGGAYSGIVNITQVAVNTAPMIGVKWTGEGIKAMLNKEPACSADEVLCREQHGLRHSHRAWPRWASRRRGAHQGCRG
jgi:hypothetical protein